jgi:hypothetical protein
VLEQQHIEAVPARQREEQRPQEAEVAIDESRSERVRKRKFERGDQRDDRHDGEPRMRRP